MDPAAGLQASRLCGSTSSTSSPPLTGPSCPYQNKLYIQQMTSSTQTYSQYYIKWGKLQVTFSKVINKTGYSLAPLLLNIVEFLTRATKQEEYKQGKKLPLLTRDDDLNGP